MGNARMNEEAIVFGSASPMVGVVTTPAGGSVTRGLGVVFLNAGVVHRIGPNRLYVSLARQLAKEGLTSLRFDHTGIGDSPPADDTLSATERFVKEAGDAMDWLASYRRCERFVLVGLCSGTLTAFNAAHTDTRVAGLVLLTALLQDPSTVPAEVVAEATDRRVMRSYVADKATSASSWRRVLTGQANYGHAVRTGVKTLLQKTRPRPVDPDVTRVVEQLDGILRRGVPIVFIYAEPTTVLEYFRMTIEPSLPELRRAGPIELVIVKKADHTFSHLVDQRRVSDLVAGWMAALPQPDVRER